MRCWTCFPVSWAGPGRRQCRRIGSRTVGRRLGRGDASGRAKDLIDRTDGVRDPLTRITLLHRALRYGRTGIQARKAYQSLGRAYEDLGKL
jgi:hypothetical protein